MEAAQEADWQQVALNGGPPCFHLEGNVVPRLCLRARRWAGHDTDHTYVSLGDLLSRALGPNLNSHDPGLDERLAGFADAEGLVLAMLDDMAEKERAKPPELFAVRNPTRAQVLDELSLALRMGQHRAAEYGDPDLARRLERAHQQMANSADRGRRGGKKASAGMTKAERVRKAKLAAEARWGKRRDTTTKEGSL
jgi:hypothetical protein